MIHIALYQPEIPPNTGNIIRLCANTRAELHLIHPLGFLPDDKQVKRAGLDYHEWARINHHDDFLSFQKQFKSARVFACSTKGHCLYNEVAFNKEDVLLFGPETRGLPEEVLSSLPANHIIRIPMQENSRSLNLSNAVAIVLYEALKQIGFNMLKLR